MPHHFAPSAGSSTIPGGGFDNKSTMLFKADEKSLNHHYDTTMLRVQSGLNTPLDQSLAVQDSVSGAMRMEARPSSPSVTGVEANVNNPLLLHPDTLTGANATAQQFNSFAEQPSWLQKASLLQDGKPIEDTISAAGLDGSQNINNISVKGSPYFISGTGQDTIQAVGVTVAGGGSPFTDTVAGTLQGLKDIQSMPSLKDAMTPGLASQDALATLRPKLDDKTHLVDVLHQVDHQVSIDLGKASGVTSQNDLSQVEKKQEDLVRSFTKDDELAANSKSSNDAVVSLLTEEERKRMAMNINFPASPLGGNGGGGPFGGGH
ncbi:hypothetical protein FAI40_08860 [Acetobacteraceae bacterium]|nr:hypothetical protein FAI40_08860 [Acetobacteraceae bacterium]